MAIKKHQMFSPIGHMEIHRTYEGLKSVVSLPAQIYLEGTKEFPWFQTSNSPLFFFSTFPRCFSPRSAEGMLEEPLKIALGEEATKQINDLTSSTSKMLANLQHLTDVYRAGHSQMDGMRMSPCHWEKYRLTLGG